MYAIRCSKRAKRGQTTRSVRACGMSLAMCAWAFGVTSIARGQDCNCNGVQGACDMSDQVTAPTLGS